MSQYPFILYPHKPLTDAEMIWKSASMYESVRKRRSVREISEKRFPKAIIENIIRIAGTAPSGANRQPWTFCVVSNPEIKKQIREMAEKEEYISYTERMPEEWKNDLAPLGTDWNKPFLEKAPYLIVVFKRNYETEANGHKHNNYYVSESVGLACGFLLMAIHEAGLVALTHTPSPMDFLTKILNRPKNERPFLLIPVGLPEEYAKVPDIQRKPPEEISIWYE